MKTEPTSSYAPLKLGDKRPKGYEVRRLGDTAWQQGSEYKVGERINGHNLRHAEFRKPTKREAQGTRKGRKV